jgi:DNA-binding transcriptional LysR family regulator
VKARTFFESEIFFGPKASRKAAARIDEVINDALVELREREGCAEAFLRLIARIRARTHFLRPCEARGGVSCAAARFLVQRLRNLAARQRFWRTGCESWEPSEQKIRPAFRSLARHLFALYETPPFMDSAWDLPLDVSGFREQAWYIQLGRGASFRSLNVIAGLTQRMEHFVRRAPDHFTIVQAARYGEAIALGASELMARQIAATRLGESRDHAAFWRTVVMFLATHRELPPKEVRPIVEFIQANKFAGEEILTADGAQTRTPPCPDFSIHGRTSQSMMRMVNAWRVADDDSSFGFSWSACRVAPYRFVEKLPTGEELDWSIVELLNSGALYAEGRAMQHCVFTYVPECRCGEAAIWSLRLRVRGEEKRMSTIDVFPQKQKILQIKAKRNRPPGARSIEIIRRWAEREGLRCDWDKAIA